MKMNYILFILILLVYQTNFAIKFRNQSKSNINIYMQSKTGSEISKIEFLNDDEIVLSETKFKSGNLRSWEEKYKDSILISSTNYQFIINAEGYSLKNTEINISTESNIITFIQIKSVIKMVDKNNQILATWDNGYATPWPFWFY